jgi:hypothetical protein
MSDKPKWQRAKILRAIGYPDAVGRFVWVITGPPTTSLGRTKDDLRPRKMIGYLTNLVRDDGIEVCCIPENIELLPVFSHAVVITHFDDWLEERSTHDHW